MPSTTSYAITINATIGGTTYNTLSFTNPSPYLTKNLTIYYSQIDPSIISFYSTSTSYSNKETDTNTPTKYTYTGEFGTFVSFTNYASGNIPYLSIANTSYSYFDASIRVFYTVNDVQYSVIITQPTPSLLCRAGITTFYTTSDNTSLSVTTDSINFNSPLQIGTNDKLTVKSEPNTTVSNSAIQTNIYKGYEATPIYKSVSALKIYYNPNNISDISATNTSTCTLPASNVSFTSVIFIKDSPTTYKFTNLSYSSTNDTSNAKNVIFQSKQLTIASSAIDSSTIYQNPLNTSDIGFQFQDDKDNYDNLISIMSSTPTTTQFYNLIKTFNTTKNITSISVSVNSTKGTLSI